MATVSIDRALSIASTGLNYYTTALAKVSQNLAAADVPGYKKVYLVGADLPYTRHDPAGAQTSSAGTKNPTGIELGMGVTIASIQRNFSQGDLNKTDNALDLAIAGDGMFMVSMPDGSNAYTRAGLFTVSPTGQLVTQPGGYVVAPGITIPATATGVKIAEDGTVWIAQSGQTTLTQIGQLQLTTFMNPSGLAAMGDTLFAETEASGAPDTGAPGTGRKGKIKQGYRETSNSNTLEEVIQLMQIEKHYNFLTKIMATAVHLWEQDATIGA